MKAIGLLFISFIIYANVFGQEVKAVSDSLAKQCLKGIWYVHNSYSYLNLGSGLKIQDSLVFKRQSNTADNMGDRIEIYDDGKFIDAYSADCGNDSGFHLDIGTWSLGENETVIMTTIPVYKNLGMGCKKHKILRLTADVLVLQKID